MSRLNRYKDSLIRFIKERSCIFEETNIPNADIRNIIYNSIDENDLTLPILLLTIMNNQNKKNSKTIQGYYAASAMELARILMNIVENKDQFISEHSESLFNETLYCLILTSYKLICQNLETVKDNYNGEIVANIFINTIKIFNNVLSFDKLLGNYEFDITDRNPENDTKQWLIKDNIELSEHYSKIKVVKNSSFKKYLNKKITALCEMSFLIGWIIGCGSSKETARIKKLARSFSYLYKLSIDFKNIEIDIMKSNISNNIVVNFGLQNAYELFMENKHKFIEDAMTLDIFTCTIKEVLNHIESSVDRVIEETSPDFKSNYSDLQSIDTFNYY